MSYVTGVVLVCALEDEPIARLNQWLENQERAVLVDQSCISGGDKHPQCAIYTAGYNYFPEDEFAAVFLGAGWEYPANAVLIMQPEQGATRIFRPAGDTARD